MTTTSEPCAATPATNSSQTPKGLGEHGRRKWFDLSVKVQRTPKNLELLCLACGAWEDWMEASEQAKGTGVIDGTGGTQKTHPAVDRKLNAAKLYRQLLKDIEWLDGSDDEDDGRPDDIDD